MGVLSGVMAAKPAIVRQRSHNENGNIFSADAESRKSAKISMQNVSHLYLTVYQFLKRFDKDALQCQFGAVAC